MMSPIIKDAIRDSNKMLEAQRIEIDSLKEHVLEIKKLLREIKSSVTRKYKK
jgi:hypothetical protein